MGAVGYRDPSEKRPHKHAELIKAWAENQDLVFQVRGSSGLGAWATIGKNEEIAWIPHLEYRIKPEPKPDRVYYGVAVLEETDGESLIAKVRYLGIANSNPDNNIKITFDSETGELKHVEIIK